MGHAPDLNKLGVWPIVPDSRRAKRKWLAPVFAIIVILTFWRLL